MVSSAPHLTSFMKLRLGRTPARVLFSITVGVIAFVRTSSLAANADAAMNG
jgi:hypothetical protein